MKNNDKDKTQLGEIQSRLRESIKQSGIPQNIIAEKIGVSPQTVSKYMTRDIFPSLETLARLCVLLDISSEEILGIGSTNY